MPVWCVRTILCNCAAFATAARKSSKNKIYAKFVGETQGYILLLVSVTCNWRESRSPVAQKRTRAAGGVKDCPKNARSEVSAIMTLRALSRQDECRDLER